MTARARPLDGQVALVTGASRGIGRGIAIGLGEAGATVYVTGRTMTRGESPWPSTLPQTAEAVSAAGGKGIALRCDHRRDDEVAAVFDTVRRDHGRLDILVNNVAGIPDLHLLFGKTKFWELDSALWDDLLDVGLRSHFIAAQHAARMMVEAGRGLIANVSSRGATRRFAILPYGVAKAALDRMSRDMAEELEGTGVSVVSLWPPPSSTEKMLEAVDEGDDPAKWSTPAFTGRVIAALAIEPDHSARSGMALVVRELAAELGVADDAVS